MMEQDHATGDGLSCPDFVKHGETARCKYTCGEGRIKTFWKGFSEIKCKSDGTIKIKKLFFKINF